MPKATRKPANTESYEQWLSRADGSVEATYSIMKATGEAAPAKLYVMPQPKPAPAGDEDSVMREVRLLRDLIAATVIGLNSAMHLLKEIEEAL